MRYPLSSILLNYSLSIINYALSCFVINKLVLLIDSYLSFQASVQLSIFFLVHF